MDTVNISVVENVETVTISVVTGFATVVNSDATYTKQAPVDATTVLPDVTHTDTNGAPTILPAMTPMVCTPASCSGVDVKNSDDTYSQHVNDGDTLTLADITVTKNDGTTYSYPAAKDLTETKSASIYTLFPTTYDMNYSHVVTAKEAGIFTNETLVNVATVEYKVNAVVKTLPITLVAGDVLLRTITQTNAALDSSVEIYY